MNSPVYHWRKLNESNLNNFDKLLVKDISYLEEHYKYSPKWIHVSPCLYNHLKDKYEGMVTYSTDGAMSTYRGLYIIKRLDYLGYMYDISTHIDYPRLIGKN